MEPEISDGTPPHRLRRIFYNDRGLRAGWRLLIYCAVLFCFLRGLFFPVMSRVQRQAPPGALNPVILAVAEALSFLFFLLAAFVMSRIERRNMGEYGLPLKGARFLQRFFTGYVVWGFLPLSVCLIVMRLLHAYDFGHFALHGTAILIWGAEWAGVFLLVGLSEEYLLRGYALHTLADGIGFWPAAIVMGVLFGIGHSGNPGETRIGLIATVVFALFASTTLRYTGNLWLAVGAHAGWNWGQSFFYGVSDSGVRVQGHLLEPTFQGPDWLTGGTVGPDGSVITLVLWTLMAVVFVLLYRKRREPALVITEGRKY
jgi:membrane protease YdiL (CAAX protease family)